MFVRNVSVNRAIGLPASSLSDHKPDPEAGLAGLSAVVAVEEEGQNELLSVLPFPASAGCFVQRIEPAVFLRGSPRM